MSVSKKLMLLSLGVLVVLCGFCAVLCFNEYQSFKRASEASLNSKDRASFALISEVVHSLQIERGHSAGYIAAASKENENSLIAARSSTDKNDFMIKNKVDALRQLVDAKDPAAVLGYTDLIAQELDKMKKRLDNLSPDLSHAADGLYYVNLLKEYYGRLRAALNGAFNANDINLQSFVYAKHLIMRIKSLHKDIANLNLEFLNQQQRQIDASSTNLKLQAFIKVFEEKNINGGFNQNPKEWFSTASELINKYKSFNDFIENIILKQSNTLAQSAKLHIIIIIITSVVVILCYVIISFFIMKNIDKKLKIILSGLREFFAFLNYKSEDAKNILLSGNDEFGNMAMQINQEIMMLKQNYEKDALCIEQIAQVARSIEQGDLSLRISCDANNPNVIALKNIFTDMLNALRSKIGSDLVKINGVIKQYANLDFEKSLQNPSGEIEQNLNTLVGEIKKMLNGQNTLSSTLKQDGADLKESMHTLKESSQQIKTMVNQSANTLDDLGQAISQIAQNSNEIKSHSEQIAGIIDIIRSVADESALLSLNASIEAARAGEHGRGFSVVASEVAKLAASTAASVSQIENSINLLLEQINNVSASTNLQSERLVQVSAAVAEISTLSNDNDQAVYKSEELANKVDKLANDLHDDLQKTRF